MFANSEDSDCMPQNVSWYFIVICTVREDKINLQRKKCNQKFGEVKSETHQYYNTMNLPGQILLLTAGAQWHSGRVLDSRQRGRVFEAHRRRYDVF